MTDLQADLCDGVLLADLVEAVSTYLITLSFFKYTLYNIIHSQFIILFGNRAELDKKTAEIL